MLGVCTVDPVSINFEFVSETGGAEGKLFISDESGDETKITSSSEKMLSVTGFFGSSQNKVSSEVSESELSIVKHIKVISVLRFIRQQW